MFEKEEHRYITIYNIFFGSAIYIKRSATKTKNSGLISSSVMLLKL